MLDSMNWLVGDVCSSVCQFVSVVLLNIYIYVYLSLHHMWDRKMVVWGTRLVIDGP